MRGIKWGSRESWLAFSLAWFWLLLFFAPVICRAESPSDRQSPPLSGQTESTWQQSSAPTPNWSGFDELLSLLETEASASRQESTELLSALVKSRTEASELSRLLGLSEQSLTEFGRSMASEREQAAKALTIALERGARAGASRDRWKLSALILAGLAVAGWGMVGVLVQ